MKVLVTGAGDMLGHALLRLGREAASVHVVGAVGHAAQHDVLRASSEDVQLCDIGDERGVGALMSQRFDVVINSAVITKLVEAVYEAARSGAMVRVA